MGQAIDKCSRCGSIGPTSDEDVCGECYQYALGAIPEKSEETFPSRPPGAREAYSARISAGSGYRTSLYIAREGEHLQGVHFVGSEQCGNCGQDMAAPEYQAFWSRDGRVVCGKCGEHYGVVVENQK